MRRNEADPLIQFQIPMQLAGAESNKAVSLRASELQDLGIRLLDALPQLRANPKATVEMTFRVDGLAVTYRLGADIAERCGEVFVSGAARVLAHCRRRAQPLGKIEQITRDERGEMVNVKSRFLF